MPVANKYRGIAQLVEQRSPKPRAEGSIPSAPAKQKTTPSGVVFCFCNGIENPRHAERERARILSAAGGR